VTAKMTFIPVHRTEERRVSVDASQEGPDGAVSAFVVLALRTQLL